MHCISFPLHYLLSLHHFLCNIPLGNLVIVDNNKSERPLTEDLTKSQQYRKEKQRGEIILNRDKKMIAEAMSKCQQTKLNPLQQNSDIGPYARKKQSYIIEENESISSDDSINAIIQTDLETDVEGPLIKKETKPPAKPEIINRGGDPQNQNLIVKFYMENFAAIDVFTGERDEKDNANLKIGTMLENIEKMQLEDGSKWSKHNSIEGDSHANTLDKPTTSKQVKPNTGEFEKLRLDQHLENSSVCPNNLRSTQCDENDKDSSKEKSQW